ncbi:MAG: protein kinase [Myxococcota bacterium]
MTTPLFPPLVPPLRPTPRGAGVNASFGPHFEFDAADLASEEERVLRHAQRLAKKAVRSGSTIAGRYRVLRIVERSARGVLVEAQRLAEGDRVWLRVVLPSRVAARVVPRLHREARVLSTLKTPHVARVLDVGQLPDGTLYFARELVEGPTVAERARAAGGLSLAEALRLAGQVAEAVREAHERGVVLRDISPDAVRIVASSSSGQAEAKLCDLGACALQELEGTQATRLQGDSRSAAPELFEGDEATERSDLWSLGCLLYEMLTGAPAFEGRGPLLSLAVLRGTPTPVTSFRSDVPATVVALVDAMLAKDPSQRPASVDAVLRMLEAASATETTAPLTAPTGPRHRPLASAPLASAPLASAPLVSASRASVSHAETAPCGAPPPSRPAADEDAHLVATEEHRAVPRVSPAGRKKGFRAWFSSLLPARWSR